MNRSLWRTLLPALAAVVLACTSVAPPVASQVPTAVVVRPTPAPTSAPTLAPTASPGASPTLAPTPVVTPTTAPGPTPTPGATPTPSLKPTETPATTLATRLTRQLRDVLNQKRNSLRIPGVSASVIFPDGSQWSNASGQSKISPSTLASAFTPFVVGSITKTFVAAAVMDMAEDGLLSIDDPLSTWMPSYPRADQMTLRHLLSHTSGVFNYFEHPTYNKRVFSTNKGKAWTPQEILDNFVSAPYFAPGAGYHYSNTNFVLLGMVVEQVSGQSLGDVFRTRLLTPVGLTGTYFQGDAAPPTTAAHGYLLKKGVFKSVSDATDYRPTISAATVAWAAGGIVSSARDIARWCDALYGGHLLEPDSVTQMTDFTYYPATNEAYGLGTRSRTFSGKRMFGHTGSLRGYVASMWYYPDLDLTVVVLTNRGRIDTNPIADALAAVALPDSQAAVDQR